MSKGKKNFPNGTHTHEDWVRLVIDKDKFNDYMVNFNTGKDGSKCPPKDLIDDMACYRCKDCQENCAKQVKEYKKHYKIHNEKFLKEDLK